MPICLREDDSRSGGRAHNHGGVPAKIDVVEQLNVYTQRGV